MHYSPVKGARNYVTMHIKMLATATSIENQCRLLCVCLCQATYLTAKEASQSDLFLYCHKLGSISPFWRAGK